MTIGIVLTIQKLRFIRKIARKIEEIFSSYLTVGHRLNTREPILICNFGNHHLNKGQTQLIRICVEEIASIINRVNKGET